MKKFKEFSNESYADSKNAEEKLLPYWDALDNMSKVIRKDLIKNGYLNIHSNARFDILSLNNNVIFEGENIKYIPFNIQIQTIGIGVKLEMDVVEYFSMIKKVMGKYFYYKMIPDTSTDYYDILIDWQQLKNSNLFKSLQGVDKFNT